MRVGLPHWTTVPGMAGMVDSDGFGVDTNRMEQVGLSECKAEEPENGVNYALYRPVCRHYWS